MASITTTLTKQLTPLSGQKSMWEDSIDMPCGTLGTIYQCWTTKGLAREVFNKITDGIRILLELSAEELKTATQGPSYPLGWTMYMIGYRGLGRASARPTLVLECRDRTVRTSAKVIISRDKFWKKTVQDYPGLKLAHSARAPQLCAGVGDTPAWLGWSSKAPRRKGEGQNVLDSPRFNAKDSKPNRIAPDSREYLSERYPQWCFLDEVIKIYRDINVNNPCGAPINFIVGKTVGSFRRATLGGVIVLNGQIYGLTAAHGLLESTQALAMSSEAESDNDFCLEDDDDEGSSKMDRTAVLYPTHKERKMFQETGLVDQPAITSPMTIKPQRTTVVPSATFPTVETSVYLGDFRTSLSGYLGDGDWAIILIEDEEYKKPNTITVPTQADRAGKTGTIAKVASDELKDLEVLAVTSSRGIVRGRVSGTPYYSGVIGNTLFQKWWTAHLEHPIGKSFMLAPMLVRRA